MYNSTFDFSQVDSLISFQIPNNSHILKDKTANRAPKSSSKTKIITDYYVNV